MTTATGVECQKLKVNVQPYAEDILTVFLL